MSIASVRYQHDTSSNSSLCVVDDLSEELKGLIRSQLSKVCNGPAKAGSGAEVYSYKRTLKQFLKRYTGKTPKTKLGMIGELLCHILLFAHTETLQPVSPLFNMEEASIKKGFDLLASHIDEKTLWITEVKSGELGKQEKEQKIRSLIDKAKDDLVLRIGSDNSIIWHTAINNVMLALREDASEKKILLALLEDLLDGSETAANDLSGINAILAPILFEDTANAVDFDTIKKKAESLAASDIFGGCVIFAIQKSTLAKVEKFLIDETAEA